MSSTPAQVPLRPVRSFPAAAVPITVGPVVATGPAADAPATAVAAITAAASPAAAAVLGRRVTSEGYGACAGRCRLLVSDHDLRGPCRQPPLPARVRPSTRPGRNLDGRLVDDA